MSKTVIMIAMTALFGLGSARDQAPSLKVGDPVPAFTLPDQDGKPFKVGDYIGKKILVIYFYPKDESPVCTKEACAFRDKYEAFTQKGALVIGINSGTVASHKAFLDHYHLPFLLLSDAGNKVLEQFGVKGAFFMTGRETFVIDLSGKVAFTYNSMLKGTRHMEETLAFIEKMQHP
jgi:thioredoxin-dependent peroxiredoxin